MNSSEDFDDPVLRDLKHEFATLDKRTFIAIASVVSVGVLLIFTVVVR